ncbi:MAG: hypothetical protein KGJ55_04285 [Gammaproteobacteria bacterium]|nr:hypothetical protein [Gammaproteobacteria bacterium]
MSRRTIILLLIAWGIILVATFVVVSHFWPSTKPAGLTELTLVAIAVGLVLVRPVMKKYPPERRITISSSKVASFQKYLLPVGAAAVLAGFAWAIVFARIVPNSQTGFDIQFFPSIALLFLGIAAIAFRVWIWFFGD